MGVVSGLERARTGWTDQLPPGPGRIRVAPVPERVVAAPSSRVPRLHGSPIAGAVPWRKLLRHNDLHNAMQDIAP